MFTPIPVQAIAGFLFGLLVAAAIMAMPPIEHKSPAAVLRQQVIMGLFALGTSMALWMLFGAGLATGIDRSGMWGSKADRLVKHGPFGGVG